MEDIIQLQTLVAHQAEEIAGLSKELYIQQKELARLRQQMLELKERFENLENSDAMVKDISEESPPPHY